MKSYKTIFAITILFLSQLFLPSYLFSKEVDLISNELKQAQHLESVNINVASAEEISKVLNGIGVNKAKKIIEYREKLGPFVSVEQLKDVSGIGQAILDKNRGKITL